MKATVSIKANGFKPAIEFPSGGRQVAASTYRSYEEAFAEARRMVRLREQFPEGCVRDPEPHQLVQL